MLFLEFFLEALAHVHDRLHVHFVERREDGIGGLRLQQTLGDACPQAAHGDALFGAVAGHGCGEGWRGRHRRLRRACGSGRSGGGGQRIGFGNAAVLARTGDAGWVEMLVGKNLGCGGHGDARFAAGGGWRLGGRGRG